MDVLRSVAPDANGVNRFDFVAAKAATDIAVMVYYVNDYYHPVCSSPFPSVSSLICSAPVLLRELPLQRGNFRFFCGDLCI
jgi:hypothetical protein